MMSSESRQPGTQRRKFPRIELDAPVAVVDLATGRTADVLDLSAGGFRTLSPTPGTAGMRHTFRFNLRDGSTCDVRAAAVHSHRAPGNARAFVVGWRAEPGHQASLARLIADVMTVPAVRDNAKTGSRDAQEQPAEPVGKS
jgi:hypothetical protein